MSDKELQQLPEAQAATLAPRNLAEAMEFAKLISQSQIVPKDYQGKAANVLVAVQWGMELGLAPMQAMQNIAVINGRPAIWGDAMLAICQSHSQFAGIDEQVSENEATCAVRRKGRPDVIRVFSVEDAKHANLWGKQGPWTQYPRRMLQMRARSWALRDQFADALKGMKAAEEVQDTPFERDMGFATVTDIEPVKTRTEEVKAKVRAPNKEAVEKVEGPQQMWKPTNQEVESVYKKILADLAVVDTEEVLQLIKDQANDIRQYMTKAQDKTIRETIALAQQNIALTQGDQSDDV